jgi:hypothetical protein
MVEGYHRPGRVLGALAADEVGALGHVGHAQVALEKPRAAGLPDQRFQLRISHDGHPEGLGDGRDGDVVVGRADAA